MMRPLLLLAALLCSTRASAQLPSASTAALGMGENFTAAARGYHAIAWNPALLGLTGNPRSSLAIAPVRVVQGLNPVSLRDIKDFEGLVVPGDTRLSWLTAVEAAGNEEGSVGADVTYLAAQLGKFGLQVSSRALGTMDLRPDAVHVLLFGNAGRNNGDTEALDLLNPKIDAFAASTIAVSYALPLQMRDGEVAIGATLKYTVGHFLLFARDAGSTFTQAPVIDVNLPSVSTIAPDSGHSGFNNGAGVGVDFGVALQRKHLTLSGVVQNAINTFEWRTDALYYRAGHAFFDTGKQESDNEQQPFAAAPEPLQTSIRRLKYRPTVAAGIALRPTDRLTIDADMRTQLGDEGIQDVPDFHVGVGIEYRVLRSLPLRVGGGAINEGNEVGAGLGFEIGRFNLDAGVLRRTNAFGAATSLMVTFVSGRR